MVTIDSYERETEERLLQKQTMYLKVYIFHWMPGDKTNIKTPKY